MAGRKAYMILSLVSFALGMTLLFVSSKANVTGAVIGTSGVAAVLSSILGIILILASCILFSLGSQEP
jgi:hypothetical protein